MANIRGSLLQRGEIRSLIYDEGIQAWVLLITPRKVKSPNSVLQKTGLDMRETQKYCAYFKETNKLRYQITL